MDAQIKSIDDLMIDDIIEREGDRFTDHPADRGGATKYGITQTSWLMYRVQRGGSVPAMDVPHHVRDITELHAREFYRVMYVQPLTWIDDLELRELVLDSAINCGATRAVKWLQRAAGCIAIDGDIGPETRKLVNDASEMKTKAIHCGVADQREDHYIDIVVRDPTQLRWLKGWMHRLRGLRR